MLPAQLCKIELGRNGVTGSTLARLAAALDVSVAELLGEAASPPVAPSVAVSESAAARDASDYVSVLAAANASRETNAVRAAVEKWETALTVAERARGVSVQTALQLVYPYGADERAAELLARDVRASLGLGRQPAVGLAVALERVGVRVVSVKRPAAFQSASFYNHARRTLSIALNAANTSERNTYRLAYELGAAVLFASAGYSTVADEGAAHRFIRNFTAAFLLPEETVRAETAIFGIAPDGWTMEALVFVKERFGVSAESFALRLESLGLITPSLRHVLRDALRARYAAHPKAMEPHPPKGQTILDIMKGKTGGRT